MATRSRRKKLKPFSMLSERQRDRRIKAELADLDDSSDADASNFEDAMNLDGDAENELSSRDHEGSTGTSQASDSDTVAPHDCEESERAPLPEENSPDDGSVDVMGSLSDSAAETEEPVTVSSVELSDSGANLAVENECLRIRKELAIWVTEDNHSERSIDRLLGILKSHKTLTQLPGTKKTLMQTQSSKIQTIKMGSGEYYHFGTDIGILEALQMTYVKLDKIDHLGLMAGVDGVPLAQSSTTSFWPIVAHVPELLGSGVFVVGLYEGPEKPTDPNLFLRVFVDDMIRLCNHGLDYNQKHFTVSLKALIADSPAKAFVTQTLGHVGLASCYQCDIVGKKVGKGPTHFPTERGNLRTEEEFLSQAQKAHHIGDITILSEIPGFLFTKCVPYDYLHLFLLGICKKLLYRLFKAARKKLSPRFTKLVSEFMLALNPDLPNDFARRARDLKYVSYFKGTELRLFLLYLGPIVLEGLKKENMALYKHFMKLHVASYILCGAKKTTDWIEYAQKLLDSFVKEFPTLHGPHSVSSNVHALLHVKEDCIRFGPLDEFSSFKYESFYGRMQFNLQSNGNYLKQYVKRRQERVKIVKTLKVKKPKVVEVSKPFHGKHLHAHLGGAMFKQLKNKACNFRNVHPNNCALLENDQIFLIDEISRKAPNFNKIMLCGRMFEAVGDLYTYPLPSSEIEIFRASSLSKKRVLVPLSAIKAKCARFCLEGGLVLLSQSSTPEAEQ